MLRNQNCTMCREYKRYKTFNSEIVQQYIFCVINRVNKIRVCGKDILNNKVVEKILHTMPMKFDHVVTTIISINESKEEVETILVIPIMTKEKDITTKREQIIVVSTMKSLGTKQLIADTNIEKTCQKIHIKNQ